MADRVIIVDHDTSNLKTAGHVLSHIGISVTALQSGQALLDHLRDNPFPAPDLILMNISLPDLDGFETLQALRRQQEGHAEIPVIFLSADQKPESETRSLQLGALDFIRKPFAPDVLISRVQNALRTQEKQQQLERNAMIDQMTGFLNKNTVEERMAEICQTETGFLCVLDLDSFKLINDLYGHDMGDQVLILFSDLLKNNLRAEDTCGRIGGDEFVLFAKNMRTEDELQRFTERINRDYFDRLKKVLGDRLNFPIGVSIGAAAAPAHGQDYRKLFHLADQALNLVKQYGNHACALNGSPQMNLKNSSASLNLESVTMILEERNISSNAMWLGRDAFINIYRYMMRYMERYHGVAYRVLFTVTLSPDADSREMQANVMAQFRHMIQASLRNSDVMVEISDRQVFLLLPETKETGIDVVIDRLMNNWKQQKCWDKAKITWEAGPAHLSPHGPAQPPKEAADWVVAVNEHNADMKQAEHVLLEQQMRVSSLNSGGDLLEFLNTNRPNLILLDARKPDFKGLELLRSLKTHRRGWEIPVLILTDDDSGEAETLGLQLGAEEFVRIPFLPETLLLRVRNTIELHRYRHMA